MSSAAQQSLLYGREDVLTDVIRSQASVTLLTGDSGIGKSAIMEAASEADPYLSNRPITVRHTQSAMHALLTALAEVATELAATNEMDKIIGGWIKSGTALADRYAQELPRIVAGVAIGLVKARLGSAANKVLDDYLAELRKQTPTGIASAMISQLEPLSAEIVREFISGLIPFAGDQRIRLSIDAGEHFPAEQLHLFADLANVMPEGAGILLALRTSGSEEVDRASWLTNSTSSIARIDVPALSESSVSHWIASEGLDASMATEVTQRTGGYGLHVADAIAHLESGGELADAPLNEEFVRSTHATWRTLADDDRRAAGKLAVLTVPLEDEELRAFLEMDERSWYSLVENLERARIFSVRVNGSPWFHDERRAGVLSVIAAAERESHHRLAAEFLWELISAKDRYELLAELSLHVENSQTLRESSKQFEALFKLSDLQLSVLAALLEVVEPANEFAAEGLPILRHWGHRWRRPGDAVEALRALSGEVIVLAEKGDAAVVVLFAESSMWTAVQLGYITRRLGQSPVRAISSVLFEWIIRPRLGVFEMGSHGQGRPSPTYLCEALARETADSNEPYGLFSTSHFGTSPFFLTAAYSDEEERDAAATTLGGLRIQVMEEDFVVDEVVKYPIGSQPSERVVHAAELALGRHITAFGRIRHRLDRPVSANDWMDLRVKTVKAVRDVVDTDQRLSMDLNRTWGIIWGEHGDRHHEIGIVGGEESALEVNELMAALGGDPWKIWSDPFASFRLTKGLELSTEAEVRNLHTSGAVDTNIDPVLYQLGELRDVARKFNTAQPIDVITLEKNELEEILTDALVDRLRLSRALANRLPIGGEVRIGPPPTLTCIALAIDTPSRRWVPGSRATLHVASCPGLVEKDEVRFAVVEGVAHGEGRDEIFSLPKDFDFTKHFGVGWPEDGPWQQGDFMHVFAELLGVRADDVTFEWP